MNQYIIPLLIYLCSISIVSICVTVKDKRAAMHGKRRTPESTLMLLGLLGGAAAMFVTMKIIRHKTRHLKFMLGLPAEILIHIILFIFCLDIL